MNWKVLLAFVFVAITLIQIQIYMHESIHVKINSLTGVKSHVDYYGWGAATVPENLPTIDLTNAQLAHVFNEAITYNVGLPILALLVLAIAFVFFQKWC